MNHDELRALCVAANVIDHNEQKGWYEKGNLLEYGLHYPKNCAYIAAMDPTTTLALLDEIEKHKLHIKHIGNDALRAENEKLKLALLDEITLLKSSVKEYGDAVERLSVDREEMLKDRVALASENARLRTLLQASTDALCLPCDRWNKDQALIVTRCVEANNLELSK